jgi:ABC-type branched-subunit amino acid transport system substrate-binding protein
LKELWYQQDPNLYAGSGDPTQEPNTYMPYAYDCVLAYAHGLKLLIDSGIVLSQSLSACHSCSQTHTQLNDAGDDITPANLILHLRNVTFDGVTGPISFDESFDRQGATYGIKNFQGDGSNELTLADVGVWSDVRRSLSY